MYDNWPDERDGATPGCSRDPNPNTPSQSESEGTQNIPDERDSLNSPNMIDSAVTEPNIEKPKGGNRRCAPSSRRGGRSFQNLISNYANTAKENTRELQNEVLQNQQVFLHNLMREQQEFEKQMLHEMLQGHKQIMSDMTNQLLTGLRNISQPPISPIRISSPISPNDSFYGSSSLSPPRPPQTSTPAPFHFSPSSTLSKPVRLILRPSSTFSSPTFPRYRTPTPPSVRLVESSSPSSININLTPTPASLQSVQGDGFSPIRIPLQSLESVGNTNVYSAFRSSSLNVAQTNRTNVPTIMKSERNTPIDTALNPSLPQPSPTPSENRTTET